MTSSTKRWILLKATALGPEYVEQLRQVLSYEYLRGLQDGTTTAVEQFHADMMKRCPSVDLTQC